MFPEISILNAAYKTGLCENIKLSGNIFDFWIVEMMAIENCAFATR